MKAEEFLCPKCGSTNGWWADCEKKNADGGWLHEDGCCVFGCDNCEWTEYETEDEIGENE